MSLAALGSLQRARLSLLVATGLAVALVVFELPLSELLHQGSELSSVASQLHAVDARNAALSHDIASLREPATVAAIAHADYGLVRPGQIAYSLWTGTAATGTVPPALQNRAVPADDLAVPAADTLASSSASRTSADGTAVSGSIWHRALERLEFWRWAL